MRTEVVNMYVGKNVEKRMNERGLKQNELAKLADCSPATISDLINNKKMPTVRLLTRVAKVLNCKMEDLFKED